MTKFFYEGWELEYFDKASNFRKYQFDLVKKYIKGHVAEVGPGNGIFLKYYRNLADKIDLYEPSENFLNNLANDRSADINIINSYFSENKNTYNTILYLDVLEHIDDDIKEIDIAHKSLKAGGVLIFNVPAFQHLYSQFDKDVNHFRRYSKTDLELKLKKFQFSKINCFYYDPVGYFLSLASRIFTKNYLKNFDKKIKVWDMLIPISKILDKIVFNKFGKSLILICKK